MSIPGSPLAIHPRQAIPGGRVVVTGSVPFDGARLPAVRIAGRPSRVVYASRGAVAALVPDDLAESARVPVEVEGASGTPPLLDVAAPFATGLHQVDSPVFDRDGNLFVTYSGTRGQEVSVSVFRVRPDGTRETFSSAVMNPTSVAVDPEGRVYVSSRFTGTVYRLDAGGAAEPFASDLGVACGLAFAADGTLFVGDRSGTIFKVDRNGGAETFASLPPSVAAFHLALGPDGTLFVAAPTLSSSDCLYCVAPDGSVSTRPERFGRPQGLAVDGEGRVYVVDALAGASGLYRLGTGTEPELVLAGPALVGAAFDPRGTLVVCSGDTAYRAPAH